MKLFLLSVTLILMLTSKANFASANTIGRTAKVDQYVNVVPEYGQNEVYVSSN